jgi:ATP-dependent helicase HrpB
VLAFGQSARVAESSIVGGVDLVVVVELDERFEPGGKKLIARQLSAIQADWLYEHFFDELEESTEHALVDGRVEERRRVRYGQLVLEESRRMAGPSEGASRVLYEALRKRDLPDEVQNQLARLATVARALPEENLRVPNAEAIDRALLRLCEGKTRLEDVHLFALVGELGLPQARLEQLAPGWVALPGRRVKVNYELDRPPWIASRLQDFCGLKQGFTVARGRVGVVLHLLAPNQRPVQLTTDLAGFWERTYPGVRRELSRRYPRHPWPVDPTVPLPPREGRGRR